MNRATSLFNSIISYSNLRLAYLKALKGKRKKSDAILFSLNANKNLAQLQRRLPSGDPGFGNYYQFTVYDPVAKSKER